MRYFILLSLFCTLLGCYSQNKPLTSNKDISKLSFIKNNKLKYTIVIMSCDTCAPIKNIGYRVLIDLNEMQSKIIKDIDSETWLQLLYDDKRDYAANLILYYLHDKDAFYIARKNTKKLWDKSVQKNEDLEYWNNLFKK